MHVGAGVGSGVRMSVFVIRNGSGLSAGVVVVGGSDGLVGV
jgi:hypothetical protein